MDSHVRSVHDQHAQDPLQHPGGHLGGEEEQHEKKSVLKKVKAKAKKIKDTIASKAHGGHGHEHGQGDDQEQERDRHEEEEEEDEEDEEVVQDPEVHGAPMYESAAAQKFTQQDVGLGAKGPLDQKPDQHGTDHRAFGAPIPPSSVTGAQSGQPKPTLGEHLREDLSAPKHGTPANYQTKATDPGAGGAVGGEETGVTPIQHKLEKMNISDEQQKKNEAAPVNQNVPMPEAQPQQGGGYISSVTSAVTGTALAAKNAVASKMGYGGNDSNQSVGPKPEQSAQPSSYTEKLSSVTHAVTDKATAAKNVVASKLGYGGSTETHPTTGTPPTTGGSTEVHSKAADQSEMNRGGEDAKPAGGATGYGRKIADKLAPVYGTVAGAGSAVMSKMPGMGSGTGTGTGTGTGSGYFADKLKPGEEDKALSDMITGAFGKRGVQEEEQKKTGVKEAVSDVIHKRHDEEEEDVKRENKPMGKVTESEQVAKRLGSSEEEKSGEVSKEETKEGVVDKFKGAFTNWFGKGGEMNPSQAFNDHSQSPGTGEQQQGISREGGENLGREGERTLQSN